MSERDDFRMVVGRCEQLAAAGLGPVLHAQAITDWTAKLAEVKRLQAEVDALKADKERLDWLEQHPTFKGKPWNITQRIDGVWTVREAIDAARKGSAQ